MEVSIAMGVTPKLAGEFISWNIPSMGMMWYSQCHKTIQLISGFL